MPDFFSGAKGEFNPALANREWDKHLAVQFPTLTAVLAGTPGPGKGGFETPPLNLTIFAKDGKLRFSVSSRDFPRTFWGSVKDALHVMESIEEALIAGEGEWSDKPPQKR
jgi:hypothetical protein